MSRFVLSLALFAALAACESKEAPSVPAAEANAPDVSAGKEETAEEATPAAIPSADVVTNFSFSDNRHLAHRFDGGGLVMDLGTAGALKYIQGRWNSTWYEGQRDGDIPFAYPRGVSGTVRFPLWVPGASGKTDGSWKLAIRLKPEGKQACDLFIRSTNGEEKKFASLNAIEDGWGTYVVDLPADLEIGQEHTLRVHFSRSKSVKGGKSAAAIDWMRIGPSASEDVPLRAESYFQGTDLHLGAKSALAWYTSPGKEARLRATLGGATVNVSRWDGTDAGSAIEDANLALPAEPLRVVFSAESAATVKAPTIVGPKGKTISSADTPKYVLLWVIDTLRADHLALYNPKTDVKTPNLDAFAKDAAVFKSATCQGNSSLPTSASIFSSAYAPNHKLTNDKARLPKDRRLFGEAFKDAGWTTGLFSSNGYVSNTWGFARGFDTEVNPIRESRPSDTEYLWPEAKAWLEKQVQTKKPTLLYINTIDPHVPYDPPTEHLKHYHQGGKVGKVSPRATGQILHDAAGGKIKISAAEGKYMEALYKGEITYNDAWFGKMLADLDTMGIRDQTMIVVTADHGEEFGEYGRFGHGVSVNQELVDVPLLIGFRPWTKGGVSLDDDVEVVDILPTVLHASGLTTPKKLQGRDLTPLIRERRSRHARSAFAYHNDFLRSARVIDWKYQLFNGDKDPLYQLDGPQGGWDEGDVGDKYPIAKRMMRDLMAFQLGTDEFLEKSAHGFPNNHSAALAKVLDSKGW